MSIMTVPPFSSSLEDSSPLLCVKTGSQIGGLRIHMHLRNEFKTEQFSSIRAHLYGYSSKEPGSIRADNDSMIDMSLRLHPGDKVNVNLDKNDNFGTVEFLGFDESTGNAEFEVGTNVMILND